MAEIQPQRALGVITHISGDTIEYRITLVDDDGNPIDMTGAIVYYVVFSPYENRLVIEKSFSSQPNYCDIFVPSSETKLIGEYLQQITIVLPSGSKYSMQGSIVFLPSFVE